MMKAFLIFVLLYAGYKLFQNVKIVERSPKKKKVNYKNMEIKDAEFEDIEDEKD
ncbi:MAG: hypothetical protein ACE5D0_00110 [Fidelibacterota bacterium]